MVEQDAGSVLSKQSFPANVKIFLVIFVIFAVMDSLFLIVQPIAWLVLPLLVHAVFLPALFILATRDQGRELTLDDLTRFVAIITIYMMFYMISEVIVAIITSDFIIMIMYLFIGSFMILIWLFVLQKVKKIRQQPHAVTAATSNTTPNEIPSQQDPSRGMFHFCPNCGASLETNPANPEQDSTAHLSNPSQTPQPPQSNNVPNQYRYCPFCGTPLVLEPSIPEPGPAAVSSTTCQAGAPSCPYLARDSAKNVKAVQQRQAITSIICCVLSIALMILFYVMLE